MSSSRSLMVAALSTLVLAACATATPYQPVGDGKFGFAEQKLESNRYKITFAGNSSTPRQTVENYLLYRAAEITLFNGFDYFVLVQQDTNEETRYSGGTVGGYYGWYSWYPRWGAAVSTTDARPITEYEAQANILVYRGEKPADNVNAMNASEIKANLEALIVRPPVKSAQ